MPSGEGTATSTRLGRPVGVDLRGADAGEVGSAESALLQGATPVRVDHGIGVEQQHVGPGSQPVAQSDVHAGGETAVAARVEVSHPELGAHSPHFGRGGVVDHGDRQPASGSKRPREQVGCAVGDDDHLDHRVAAGRIGGVQRAPIEPVVGVGHLAPTSSRARACEAGRRSRSRRRRSQ